MKITLIGGPGDGKSADIDSQYTEIIWPVVESEVTAPVATTLRIARYKRPCPKSNRAYYTGNLEAT